MKIILKVFFLIQCLSIQVSGQTFSVYNREQIGSLPQGRMMISVVGFQSQINSIYNYQSEKKDLSSNLNRQVKFSDITNDDQVRTQQLKGLFSANDVDLQSSAGSIAGSIETLVDGQVPVIGYGLTDDISIIATVPMIHFTLNSNYNFNQSAETAKFLEKLKQQDQGSVARDFKKAFQYSLESKLYKLGYKWNGYVDKKVIGDAQIHILKKINEDSSISGIIILPTADLAKTDDLFELKGGDKKIGLGYKYALKSVSDYGFGLSNSFSNIFLLPTVQPKRLYLSAEDEIKEGLDDKTRLGAVIKLSYQIQARYEFPSWLGLSTGFNWQYKTAEVYNGDKYDASVYNLNSSRTAEDLRSYYIAADLNSIKSFLAGNFLVPMSAEVGVSIPMNGQNAIAESVYQLQGSVFF